MSKRKEIIIAFAALILSAISLGYTIYFNYDSNLESVTVSKNYFSLKESGVRIDNNENFLSMAYPLELTISNNSRHSVSIIDFKSHTTYNDSKIVFATFVDSANRKINEEGKLFPINLKSFESRNVTLWVEIYLNKNVINALFENTNIFNNSDDKAYWFVGSFFDSALNKRGINILGNNLQTNGDIDLQNKQSLHLEFITSTKSRFYSLVSL